MLILRISILATLGVLFVQDLKSRRVLWVLFPILILLFISFRVMGAEPIVVILKRSSYPLAFILLQIVLVSLYISLKYKRWVDITKGMLGWGDILFMASLCFFFSLFNFLIIYFVSTIMILMGWSVWKAATNSGERHIPLAGLQALFVAVILLVNWLFPFVNPGADDSVFLFLNAWQ